MVDLRTYCVSKMNRILPVPLCHYCGPKRTLFYNLVAAESNYHTMTQYYGYITNNFGLNSRSMSYQSAYDVPFILMNTS